MPLLAALVLAILVVASAPAAGEFGLKPGSFAATGTDDLGETFTQAGGHPNATTAFAFNEIVDRNGSVLPDEDVKEIQVDLPVGLVGNPQGVPRCPQDLFNTPSLALCPTESQVGITRVTFTNAAGFGIQDIVLPVYNLVPPEGRPARFGFRLIRSNVVISTDVRSDSDYGVVATIRNLPGGVYIHASSLTLWGVPAAAAHDAQRFRPGETSPGDDPSGDGGPDRDVTTLASTAQRSALMINPTSCGAPPVTKIAVRSWQNPDRWVTEEATSPAVTGCDRLRFEPSISLVSRAPKAFSPSGYDVMLSFRQPDDPVGLAPAQLKDASVTLPPGVLVNPSSAGGLEACSPAQIGLNVRGPAACPGASKIGTVDIQTPLLERNLTGSIYLGQQTPTQLITLYLVAEGSGVTVKLAGTVSPDTITGRLTATFRDNPQLPVSEITLSFKDGQRAPLSNPRTCGGATTTASLTPWSGMPAALISSTFIVTGDGKGAACPAHRFAPTFVAGTHNPAAGASSPFTVSFGRADEDEFLSGIAIKMPRGLLARISHATLCNDAEANAGTCSEASRIGSVTTSAGAGTIPISIPGRVYVTGPYKGAPFGLSIVVPAVAGPFDLGVVVVRASIAVDRRTAELAIASDPLPTILRGVPLQVRLVDVQVDRDRFMINPTNCSALSVGGAISSTAGDVASVSSRFQAANCRSLPYTPRLTLTVGARGKVTRGKRTPLTATIDMREDQANNRVVQVTLPKTINARLDVVNKRRACTEEQFKADRCPMVVGTATAVTPLLRDPLRGNAYFVYTSERRLPDLVLRLKGQVDFDLVGKVTITRDLRLRTTFDAVPDVPITKFSLRLASGPRNGPLGIVNNLCVAANRKRTIAKVGLLAQSGKALRRPSTAIKIVGCARRASTRRTTKARSKKTTRRGK